jgi:hypothetical protein
MWTKATVLGGVAAVALVAGGAGMAIASAQGTAGPDVATVSPTGDPSPTVSPSANPAKAGKIDRDDLKQILGRLKDFQHAEWVTTGDANAYVTHEAILGEIRSVSSTVDHRRILRRHVDDLRGQRPDEGPSAAGDGHGTPTIADLKTGQTVLVGGVKTPDLTARNVLVRAS